MPLCYLRRPLFLVLVLYILVLALLHSRGFFEIKPQREILPLRFHPFLGVEGVAASPLREDHRGQKVFLRAMRFADKPVRQKVLVYLPRGLPENERIRPGQRLLLSGELRLPRPSRNPGEFDERAFLWDRGVGWILKAESLRILPKPIPWPWLPFFWAESARRSLENCFKRLLSQEEARLMTGLALGYKGPLRRDVNRAIQDAGVMHLLVPSGAKVAFVIMAAAWVALRLGGRTGGFVFSGLLGGFYTLMVGTDPPYARAFLGGMALQAGFLRGRESGAFQATVLSALAILILDPRALFSAGFQMTYLAMAGLLLAMPSLNRALRPWPAWLGRLAAVAAVTAVVQLMLWPLFANIFGRGSLLGAAANLVLVPGSGAIMALGFSLWGLSFVMEGPLLAFLVKGLKLLLTLFCRVCFQASSWPGAASDLSPMAFSEVLAYYLAVFSLLVLPRRRPAAALLGASLLVWGGSAWAQRAGAPALRVVYLSLPSRAALVTFSGEKHWLVGAGASAGMLLKVLRIYRVRRLEKVVLTGPDPGLRRALPRLARFVPVGAVEEAGAGGGVGRRLVLLCQHAVCFGFDPPRVRRGEAEFSIIPPRLKRHALEVSTDGYWVSIKPASGVSPR